MLGLDKDKKEYLIRVAHTVFSAIFIIKKCIVLLENERKEIPERRTEVEDSTKPTSVTIL